MNQIDLKLHDENGRLASLQRYDVLGSPPEAPFDKVTSLVKAILNVPIAIISLVDQDRQWFKSCIGLEAQETARDISFCTHTIQARDPLIIPDAMKDPRFAQNPLVTGSPHIASYAGVPLQTPDGYNLGSLCAIDTVPRAFDASQIAILRTLAAIVIDEFEMRKLAQLDFLTGAVSRMAFLAEAGKAISRFTRRQTPSAIVMFDLDHFKRVNDLHGHAAGDLVLRAVGGCISGMIRPTDSLGRLGGEEFAVLLADTTLEAAAQAAERYRIALEALVVPHDPPLEITASFGVAILRGECPTAEGWLEKADLMLYLAKRHGRNRCCIEDV